MKIVVVKEKLDGVHAKGQRALERICGSKIGRHHVGGKFIFSELLFVLKCGFTGNPAIGNGYNRSLACSQNSTAVSFFLLHARKKGIPLKFFSNLLCGE